MTATKFPIARAAQRLDPLDPGQDEREVRGLLQTHIRQQAAVAELGQDALRGLSLQELFQKATEQVAQILRNEYCKVLELLPDGKELLLRAGVGWKPGLMGVATVGSGRDSQAGYTLLSDSPVIVEDLRTETRFSGPQLLHDHGVVSGMSVIIRKPDGSAWGVLGTHTTRRFQFTEDDINFLQAVSNTLGTAIMRQHSQEALERAVEQRTQELRAANRELEAFSYSVSHDLRNRLRSVDGLTNIVASTAHDRLTSEERGNLSMTIRACREMGRLIDDLLRLSQISRATLTRRPTDLSAIAREILKRLRVQEPGRNVEVQVEDGMASNCDEGLVRLMMENLLENAWKFTRYSKPVPRIEVRRERSENGQQHFVVRDNGAGFDAAAASRLFEPFQRFHRSDEFEGTGVGLAIVQRVVARHGGRVWARSSPGTGTEMHFTLQPSNS